MHPEKERPDSHARQLLLGVALALLVLAAPIQFSGYRITMTWALEAAAAMWIASRTQSKLLAAAAVLALWLAAVRLFAFDSWIYSSAAAYTAVANARFATFLVAGAAFLLAARWLFAGWQAGGALPVVISGVGHIVLLWGLGLEVLGWAGRTASPENLRNVESASISILIAAYAVVLAGLGIATRTLVNRVFGLGLIGLVVVKLYVYDVWNLRLLYRVLAFAGLGGLLLLMSFLYSRYRGSIDALWQRGARGDGKPD
jgi:hypothetical protein